MTARILDQKVGELLVFSEQVECATEILHNGKLSQLLIAQMQQGKTGTAIYVCDPEYIGQYADFEKEISAEIPTSQHLDPKTIFA